MRHPTEAEVVAFKIGLDYAIEVVRRLVHEQPDDNAHEIGKLVIADLGIVRITPLVAQDSLKVRMQGNNQPKPPNAAESGRTVLIKPPIYRKDCHACNGTGEVQEGEHGPEVCTGCNGTGLIQEGAD